jgi:hypothetical protein
MTPNDEFFIGWEDAPPPGIARWTRRVAAVLATLAVMLGVGLALAQRTIGVAVFEWGTIKSFSGILQQHPYPHLLVPRPGAGAGSPRFSSYYLVNPYKFGLDANAARRFHGHAVDLTGTLIYRDNQTMIEVVPGSIRDSATLAPPLTHEAPVATVKLGRQTLIGEIVDSKCYLGVMNPGQQTPHRACAIRCISGGIPPVLLVRQDPGPPLCLLLVSRDGDAVNRQILHLVAEPVEITGEVERQGELLILRADPAHYRRVRP